MQPRLRIAGLLLCIDVPDNVVWKAEDAVARAPRHLGETFGLGLVLEGVAWEVDTCTTESVAGHVSFAARS